MRKIVYISGTRADFGLMKSTLQTIDSAEELDVSVIATGMHLDQKYGYTIDEIRAAGLNVIAEVPVPLSPANGITMSRNIGEMIARFTAILSERQPDIVLLLGDRGEMLAGAIAALHLNLFIVHIHGGERSGTTDEPVRHAVSKLSHFHFCATQNAKDRLIKMGEREENIFVAGAPGLNDISEIKLPSRDKFAADFQFKVEQKIALFVFHPVLQEAKRGGSDTQLIFDILQNKNYQIIALRPNSDAGSDAVNDALELYRDNNDIRTISHLERDAFLTAMAMADVMIGNSSAGIIEAASFGTPVINVGIRQNLRERNSNVVDIRMNDEDLREALTSIERATKLKVANIYGDGTSAEQITRLLQSIKLGTETLMKVNSY